MRQLQSVDNHSFKTFAYAASLYLKTRDKYSFNFEANNDSIHKYLPKIQENNKNYSMLFDIHILLGNTYKRRGQMKAALDNYLKAENYALIINDVERIVKIKGNVALVYQGIRQLDNALNQIITTYKIVENNKVRLGKKYNSRKFQTLLNTSAIYNSLLQDNNKNLQYGDSSIHCLNKILSDKDLKLSKFKYGQVYRNLATAYSLKKEYAQAEPFFQKSIEYFSEINAQADLYNAFYNTGVNYLEMNNLHKSKDAFQEVLRIKQDTLLDPNYVNAHKYLSEIYVQQNNKDSASYYFTKHQKILEQATKEQQLEYEKIFSADETYQLKKKIDSLEKVNSENKNMIIVSLILLIAIIVTSTIIIYKNVKEKRNAKSRLRQLLDIPKEIEKETNNQKLVIKDEHHAEVIEGLIKIEKKLFFLKEEFNLYTTAKKIGTNTTYLSKIIREHKKMTFSEYSNDLKIKYIVEKLKTDKTVRAYTTQAIGEIGGYKNAKSFTRIFKKYTGITPFQFIDKIETELEKLN
ncbi:tetratricopeptide repeat protein [Tenacibaculum sp. SZ-18]|uniref:tetratricopeptide repeat protein n=1 Tax=Tenacibaculum sp. SZ-18 TaxID=754423 RepID=UPI0018E2232E|nr:tetratricopeptide repeat protein [Tenacibaculum sp. SZ-18]